MEGFWKERCSRNLYLSYSRHTYDRVTTSGRTLEAEIKDFLIRMDSHHDSILSPYLFNLVLDVLARDTKDYLNACFLQMIVLIKESRKEVNSKHELWRQMLESLLNRSKLEYMHHNFSKKHEENNLEVKIKDVITLSLGI